MNKTTKETLEGPLWPWVFTNTVSHPQPLQLYSLWGHWKRLPSNICGSALCVTQFVMQGLWGQDLPISDGVHISQNVTRGWNVHRLSLVLFLWLDYMWPAIKCLWLVHVLLAHWCPGHNKTWSIPFHINICFQSGQLSPWNPNKPPSQYTNTCYYKFNSNNSNMLAFAFYTENGWLQKHFSLLTTGKHIQHILVSA